MGELVSPIIDLGIHEWEKEKEEEAYGHIGEFIRNELQKVFTVICGEAKILDKLDELKAIEYAAEVRKKGRLELIFHYPNTKRIFEENLEPDVNTADEISKHIEEHIVKEPEKSAKLAIIKKLFKSGWIRLFLSPKALNQHFGLADDKYLFLQQVHLPGERKKLWFIDNAWLLRRLYRHKLKRVKDRCKLVSPELYRF